MTQQPTLDASLEQVLYQVKRVIVGQDTLLERMVVALLARGHLLVEGVPGLAKTMAVKTLAEAIGGEFQRIQFTPDLVPADIVGTRVFNQKLGEFQVSLGPVFANLVLADEINRAPAKVQSALLEAMQERQVTIDGRTHSLGPPFFVLATQNPIEYEGTYPLPEAQLDRFLLRVGVGYPSRGDEWEVLARRLERAADEVELEPVVERETLVEMQRSVEQIHVDESVGYYIVDLVAATRAASSVQVGASPRGSLALLKLARGRAALSSRDYVIPEDVKAVAVPALAHRLTLRPELWVQRLRPEEIVRGLLDEVPTPAAEPVRE